MAVSEPLPTNYGDSAINLTVYKPVPQDLEGTKLTYIIGAISQTPLDDAVRATLAPRRKI